MQFEQIVIRYGELSLKGRNRKQFIRQLKENLDPILAGYPRVHLKNTRDRMYIMLNGEDYKSLLEQLKKVFGIHSFSLAIKTENIAEEIQKGAFSALHETNPHAKTFKISAKRANKEFPINSQELNHVVGSYILRNTENLTVDVHNPDVNIKVEVRQEGTYISCADIPGAGGLPVGSSGKVVLMLSGGIDSPVAGYLAMKRGVTIEAVHFHTPPFTSERAKQKVIDLMQQLTRFGGKLKLHIVPFTELQQKLNIHIPDNYRMTAMRRMMLRIAERIAANNNALAIATGESLGQVASQTLHSMNTINEVTNYPVLRPLITMDKVEIIEISKHIGTYDISIRPYEDCCTVFVPTQPKTKPRKDVINKFEQGLEIDKLIDEVISNVEVLTFKPTQQSIHKEIEDLF